VYVCVRTWPATLKCITYNFIVSAHRKDAAFSRWQPRTLNAADGFTLGNIFNKKQRAGFEKLATVEVSEDDDDGDDDDNDLNVRA